MADKKCKSCGEWVVKETVICPHCHEKASWNFISLAIVLIISLIIGIGIYNFKPRESQPTSQTSQLEETCKDWIYNRNRALKLGKAGDQVGAEKARQAMRAFQKDLDGYPHDQVTAAIERLEKSGYRAGF
jgi:hypothetical protein